MAGRESPPGSVRIDPGSDMLLAGAGDTGGSSPVVVDRPAGVLFTYFVRDSCLAFTRGFMKWGARRIFASLCCYLRVFLVSNLGQDSRRSIDFRANFASGEYILVFGK